MREWLQGFLQIVAGAAETGAALVIAAGMAQALWDFATRNLRGRCSGHETAMGRLKLGYALSLALELLIGADILKSAVSPTWADLGQLAAIVGIRTVLNYFLLFEMRVLTKEEGRAGD